MGPSDVNRIESRILRRRGLPYGSSLQSVPLVHATRRGEGNMESSLEDWCARIIKPQSRIMTHVGADPTSKLELMVWERLPRALGRLL